MSKSLAEYGEQKSCAVTTAKRLADFLGDAMVKDKGLRCQYVVACEPKVETCNNNLVKFFLLLIFCLREYYEMAKKSTKCSFLFAVHFIIFCSCERGMK